MRRKAENTPPPSPGIGSGAEDDDDELFEDQIQEEIDVLEGETEVSN